MEISRCSCRQMERERKEKNHDKKERKENSPHGSSNHEYCSTPAAGAVLLVSQALRSDTDSHI